MKSPPDMPESLKSLRTALVHDYLNQQGGAENMVEVFADMFPGAPVFTSVYDRDRMPDRWRRLDIRTSFMQRISPRMVVANALLPLYPTAFESFDLRDYDLVLSSSTTFAKGVLTRPETLHICYCNNPTRFLWMYQSYVEYEQLPAGALKLLPWLATLMRSWDFTAAQRVDHFIANSENVRRRIWKFYRRESEVLYPPIETSEFRIANHVGEYFLVVARLQPYKRIDLAIEACTRLGVPLHVVGEGPDLKRLRALAGPHVRFLGRISTDERRREMAECRALLFTGEEDFGLTVIETQASGRPVIAYAAGGALETVKEGVTGTFFREQSVECLARALSTFTDSFDPVELRKHALAFDTSQFRRRLYELIARRYSDHKNTYVTVQVARETRASSSGPE